MSKNVPKDIDVDLDVIDGAEKPMTGAPSLDPRAEIELAYLKKDDVDFFPPPAAAAAESKVANKPPYVGYILEWFKDPLMLHLSPMYKLGNERPLTRADCGEFLEQDTVEVCEKELTFLWEQECIDYPQGQRRLTRVVRKFFGMTRIILSILLFGVFAANSFAAPMIIKLLLQHFSGFVILEQWKLYCIAAYSLVMPCFALSCREMSGLSLTKAGSRLRAGLVPLIFKTAMNLSPDARTRNGGKINNLFASDVNTLADIFMQFPGVFYAPISFAVGIYLIEQEVGKAILIAFPVIGGTFPVLLCAMLGFGFYIRRKLVLTDQRITITKEAINGIRILKYYAWELPFSTKVKKIREEEIKEMSGIYYCWLLMELIMQGLPVALPIAVFFQYARSGNSLTYSTIFTSLSLFQTLMAPLQQLTGLATTLSYASAALGRIQVLLEETQRVVYVKEDKEDKENSIIFKDATMSWVLEPPVEPTEAKEGLVAKDGVVPSDETATSALETIPSIDSEEEVEAETKGNDRSYKTIRNLSLSIKKGSLTAVIGPVGCGKSSVISALLGEMYLDEGNITVNGTLAYHSQQSWIINANIMDNIIFGNPLDTARLLQVLEAAALLPDIEILPAGLETEIGEKGINLSGGQKARVSLARTLYSNADTVLLDDPLSAVDANVCDHLFHKAIKAFLCDQGKTVVLVTHQVHLLAECDSVILINNDGTIRAACRYDELEANGIDTAKLEFGTENEDKDSEEELFEVIDTDDSATALDLRDSTSTADARVLKLVASDTDVDERPRSSSSLMRDRSGSNASGSAKLDAVNSNSPNRERSSTDKGKLARSASGLTRSRSGTKSIRKKSVGDLGTAGSNNNNGSKLMIEEDREVGLIGSDVYTFLVNSGGALLFCIVVFFGVAGKVISVFSLRFISTWGEANVTSEIMTGSPLSWSEQHSYLNTYALISMLGVCFLLLMRYTAILHGIGCSRNLHHDMVDHVFKCPTGWFDVTPLGRIINRFTGDIGIADQGVSAIACIVIGLLIDVGINLVTIATLTKGTFLIVGIPLVFAYYFVSSYFRRIKVELQRLINIDKSPVFVELSQSLSGVSSLRAFDKILHFEHRLKTSMDTFGGVSFLKFKAESWMIIRLEFLGSVLTFFVILIATTTTDIIPTEYLGMALTYSYQTTVLMTIAVYLMSQLESMLAGVQRVKTYSDGLPQEEDGNDSAKPRATTTGAADVESSSLSENWKVTVVEPPADWPSVGKIEFIDVQMRYRDQELVLKGVDFTIDGQEKVGVAGRTGSGKSTLFVTLFRIENLARGRIEIDGIDIATVPLKTLRSRLCIIPQDPVMFTDTLRRNVDPFDNSTDAEIINALDKVKLTQMVKDMPEGIQTKVTEGGENLSVGQRQLICFARALLRSPKIVVLDEATAAIDNETDQMIQEMITDRLKDCTVLTIAHRLHTIVECDRIIIMDNGRVAEVDTPAALKLKKDGIFKQMWETYETAHHQ